MVMTPARLRAIAVLAIPILVIGEFLTDLFVPLGITDWVWYAIPLIFSFFVGGRSLPYVLAAVLSILLLVGFYLSPRGIDPEWALISRLMGILALWVMALMIWHHKKSVAEVSKLSRAVEHSPVSIVITDKAGNIEYVNPKFTEVTGYSFKEVVGKNPRLLKGNETPPEAYKRLWETIKAGGEWRGEFHNRKKNGELYWESASISGVADAAGNVTHFLAVKEDITERKQNEKALAMEQSLLSSLITAIPDRVYFKDRDGRFIRINEAFARNNGLPDPSAALGKTDFDIFGEEHARQASKDEKRIMATGQPIVEKEEKVDWKDKHVSWVSSTKLPLRDNTGTIVGIMGISRDITERKQAEEAFTRERNLLRAIFDLLPDYIYLKDEQSRFIMCNNRRSDNDALQDTSELIGKTDADFFPPELAAQFRADELRVLAGTSLIDKEETLTRPNGNKQIILTTKLPFRDSNGKIIGLLGHGRDITGYKRATESLQAEQKLLNNLMTVSPDIIYFKDRESRFIRINDAFARKLALSDSRAVLGKTDFDIFGGQHAGQAYDDEQRIMATGEPMIDKEEQEDWKDGRVTWVSSTKMPMRDSTGQIIGIMGISRDITERKRAERRLTEALDFNQKIISDAEAGISVYKASGQCVLVNEYAAKTVNGTTSRMLEQNFRQLESWRGSGMLKVAEEALASGKPQECEARIVSTFGKELWLVCHFTPFVLSDQPHLLMLFTDITGRKAAEAHIQEQAALLDKAQDAIFVLDPDNRISYWNQSAERIYGWTVAEAVGKSVVELLYKGVVTPQLAHTMKTVSERGEWVGELQEYTKAGKTITVQGRCNLIRDAQGHPKSRLIINTDVTEKKNFETQFLRSQRMEGIGSLAGGIAHDLNNILTPLLVAVQVLKEKVNDEDGRKLLQALETNVQRGAGLVKQVLAFGRGVTGERIAVNPKHIVREIKQIIHETFPKSLEYEFRAAPDLWTITGDPTQLHQVLLNLCVNARDAMPKGGKLSVSMDNLRFDETYAGMNPEAEVGPYVCIKVTDTGTGMPREIQNKIFDPFFTTKEPGKGTGLGLSTTLTIVKSHNGFIHLHSAPDKGSTFEIYFPANATPVAAENEPKQESRLPRGHNELVLIVDDEEPIRKIAQKTLERFGYRVLLAADGAEALSIYAPRQQEIDAVITDMVMPIMDGPATILALKAINAAVKIVTSSGMTSDGGMAKARNAGVRHFIPKPYTAETMLTTLDEILHEHHVN